MAQPIRAVATADAPGAIGTYSQALIVGDLVFVSGQIPLVAATGELASIEPVAQIRQIFENLAAVARAAGTSLARAVKLTVYLTDLQHFTLVNEVMARYCAEPYPARAAVGVAALPRGALCEIDAILAR